MPEAEKFNALGAGNGFPVCVDPPYLGYLDVTNYYDYKALTLEQVMDLYWNLAGVSGSAAASFSFFGGATASASLGEEDLIIEPKNRVCTIDRDLLSIRNGERNDTPFLLYKAEAYVGVNNGMDVVWRLFDNGEFVGYGFGVVPSNSVSPGFAYSYAASGDWSFPREELTTYTTFQRFADYRYETLLELQYQETTNEVIGNADIPVFRIKTYRDDEFFSVGPEDFASTSLGTPQFYTY